LPPEDAKLKHRLAPALLALILGAAPAPATPETGPQVFEWRMEGGTFGGFSGLLVEDHGKSLLAVSDHGTLYTGTITRENGAIRAITATGQYPLSGPGEPPFTDFQRDAEDLARLRDGSLLVSFESYTRVKRYAAPGAKPRSTHQWNAFRRLFGNQSFEAIAPLPDGRIAAWVEGKGRGTRTSAFLYDGKSWAGPFAFPISDGFAITGADLGPDGRLYLVERRFNLLAGFSFRIRRLTLTENAMLSDVLYTSPAGKLGNAEGIAAWRDDTGQLVLTLITDNGFSPLSPTRLIEFRLPEAAPGPRHEYPVPFPPR
jgi:hypothetical protein